MSAIPRYGARIIPNTEQTIAAIRTAGQIVDVESLHVDVCTRLPLFGNGHAPTPGAERTAEAIQLPVYASLKPDHIDRIATVVREAVAT